LPLSGLLAGFAGAAVALCPGFIGARLNVAFMLAEDAESPIAVDRLAGVISFSSRKIRDFSDICSSASYAYLDLPALEPCPEELA
jgi:hypothetical protein